MIFSKQKWFCTCCGKEQFTGMCGGTLGCIGPEWKCCSIECHREMEWRRVLSIMGKEYYPDPKKEEKNE